MLNAEKRWCVLCTIFENTHHCLHQVYRGLWSGRTVAVKVVAAPLPMRQQVLAEGKLATQLQHPNVVITYATLEGAIASEDGGGVRQQASVSLTSGTWSIPSNSAA